MYKLVFLFTILYPSISHAYLGPGIGGGIIAATLGIIIAIFAAIFGIFWFPIKRFLKKKKGSKKQRK